MKPIRTCAVCRKRREKSELLRVVKNGETTRIDERQRMDGRGAYVCKDPKCLEAAIKKRAFDRAFKCRIGPELYQTLAERCKGEYGQTS